MKIRSVAAAALFVATVAGGTWLYLYRVPSVARFIDQRGHVYHAPYTISVQPWWSVFAAVLLLAVGTAVTIWVMPSRSRVLSHLRQLGSATGIPGGQLGLARLACGLALLGLGAVVTQVVRVTSRAAHSFRVTRTIAPLLFR